MTDTTIYANDSTSGRNGRRLNGERVDIAAADVEMWYWVEASCHGIAKRELKAGSALIDERGDLARIFKQRLQSDEVIMPNGLRRTVDQVVTGKVEYYKKVLTGEIVPACRLRGSKDG